MHSAACILLPCCTCSGPPIDNLISSFSGWGSSFIWSTMARMGLTKLCATDEARTFTSQACARRGRRRSATYPTAAAKNAVMLLRYQPQPARHNRCALQQRMRIHTAACRFAVPCPVRFRCQTVASLLRQIACLRPSSDSQQLCLAVQQAKVWYVCVCVCKCMELSSIHSSAVPRRGDRKPCADSLSCSSAVCAQQQSVSPSARRCWELPARHSSAAQLSVSSWRGVYLCLCAW